MSVKAILGFIFGLLGFLGQFFGIVPLAMCIAGIVLGASGMKDKEGKGLAIAGLVLGIIGSIGALFWTFVWGIAFASV